MWCRFIKLVSCFKVYVSILLLCKRSCQAVDKSTVFTCSKALRIIVSSLDIRQWRERRSSSSSRILSSSRFACACRCCSGCISCTSDTLLSHPPYEGHLSGQGSSQKILTREVKIRGVKIAVHCRK